MERDYEILVYGATGFTGRLTAEYLAKNYGKMKIALGGRDKGKLEILKDELKEKFSVSFDILIADSNNFEQLCDIVKRTKVVASIVGPYLRYGNKMVEACIKMETHYVDLTGESVWIKQIQEKYHEEAKKKNVKIVNCCGFDSIPSDVSVYMMNKLAKEKFGEKEEFESITAVYSFNHQLQGSGGTIESIFNMFTLPMKEIKEMSKPSYLCQKVKEGKSTKQNFFSFHKESEMWTFPFVMATVNEHVVRKSNDLQEGSYGKNLNYGECAGSKSFKTAIYSFFISLLLSIFFILAIIPPVRNFLRKYAPKPSEGPSRSRMEKIRCSITYFGKTKGKKNVYANVQINGDPGYLETAKMISECALCIVSGEDKVSPLNGGILTPSTAFGESIHNRLNKVNYGIKVYLNK